MLKWRICSSAAPWKPRPRNQEPRGAKQENRKKDGSKPPHGSLPVGKFVPHDKARQRRQSHGKPPAPPKGRAEKVKCADVQRDPDPSGPQMNPTGSPLNGWIMTKQRVNGESKKPPLDERGRREQRPPQRIKRHPREYKGQVSVEPLEDSESARASKREPKEKTGH